jgi:D-3-phosphoglycerate dehydrogenase / 2-oxoglutarate reductase
MEQRSSRVVITDCDHGSIAEEMEVFDCIGVQPQLAQVMTEEEVIDLCRDAEGVITQYAVISRRVMERLPRCKVIARYGVGVDTIDLKAATDLGIVVCNVPDYCLDEVADHAVALILSLVRKTAFFDRKVKSGRWDFRLGMPIHRLQGKTLGLVGCGKIGLKVANRISAFGVKVTAFDPYLKDAGEWITLTDLDTVLKSDIISIHCPLNESTRHLISEEAFGKMEQAPLLINTSRGPIVDEQALIRALETRRLGGAGLDVLEKEPPDPDHPFLKMENVILTPHTSFFSQESISELKRRVAQNVRHVLEGEMPESVVNREVLGKTRAPIPVARESRI